MSGLGGHLELKDSLFSGAKVGLGPQFRCLVRLPFSHININYNSNYYFLNNYYYHIYNIWKEKAKFHSFEKSGNVNYFGKTKGSQKRHFVVSQTAISKELIAREGATSWDRRCQYEFPKDGFFRL